MTDRLIVRRGYIQYLQLMPRGMKISKQIHLYHNCKINGKYVDEETQLLLRLF